MGQDALLRALALVSEAQRILLAEVGGPTTPVIVPPTPIAETPVIYGRDSFTNVNDPRAQNARRHWSNGGKVLAVHLQVHVLPDKPYRVTDVKLIDENDAGGNHYARVLQTSGSERVALFMGYGGGLDFDGHLDHAPGQEVIIDGDFNPPDLGPLAIALIDKDGNIISDVVASLGLPFRHHVCYEMTFDKRC